MTNVRTGQKGFIAIPLTERFWAKVERRDPAECWPWLGSKRASGCGQIWVEGRLLTAPRVSWMLHHGSELPKGREACHSCDNPNCVNPAHIWAGTHHENMLDALAKNRLIPNRNCWLKHLTHCKRGHPLSGDNLYVPKSGYRHCRECQRMHSRKYEAKARSVQGEKV